MLWYDMVAYCCHEGIGIEGTGEEPIGFEFESHRLVRFYYLFYALHLIEDARAYLDKRGRVRSSLAINPSNPSQSNPTRADIGERKE
mmetsp:Transcript_21149/g.46132  ORF Transcript_21149/g.46132 Transcript_21149/m.46132 type:complete len:87 (-) Transcript_21149:319-579(-)